ncbi:Non-hem dioxygenase N-terminal domain [Dillenia turbinata]|uniref:Non-hem dioxygenase N-terminal domain n=1 Tax=Dillenia turbinata TaxID=194707 RepID=A0AAN8W5J7_9MAGN
MAANKSAQQMSIDGDQPPERFIVRESSFGVLDICPPTASIPVINLSLLTSSDLSLSSKEEVQELDKLRLAFSSWGCVQVVNHGISNALLEKVLEISKKFFALPMEEKNRYARAIDNFEGYGGDRIVSEKQVLDWMDRLSLMVFPQDQRKLNYWPKDPKNFGDVLHEYAVKTKLVMDKLLKAMAKSLNVEEDSFAKKFGDRAIMKARFCFYPSCPRPDQVLGLKPHSDRSGLTTILQDTEVEGLHVCKDNQWFGVIPIPYAIFVNLGDQMQILSNGMFKSPLHRVVTNAKTTRRSIAMFNEPEPEEEIGPVHSLIDEKRPRVYKRVKNYANFNFESFQKGQVPLEAMKI